MKGMEPSMTKEVRPKRQALPGTAGRDLPKQEVSCDSQRLGVRRCIQRYQKHKRMDSHLHAMWASCENTEHPDAMGLSIAAMRRRRSSAFSSNGTFSLSRSSNAS